MEQQGDRLQGEKLQEENLQRKKRQEHKPQEHKQKMDKQEEYEKVRVDLVEEIEARVKEQFGDKAWLYAVLDFAVGFGIYENGSFMIGLGNYEKPVPLEWEYLQELRIFNETGELRLAPIQGEWVGRYRGSNPLDRGNVVESNEYCIDEHQKIWGKVKDDDVKDDHTKDDHAKGIGMNGIRTEEQPAVYDHKGQMCGIAAGSGTDFTQWSLLTSERGTRIWVPVKSEAQEWAVCVKKFMRIPTVKDKELVYQTDIRMLGFYPWSEDDGKAGSKIG